jgi:hypothetical protein
MAKSQIMVLVSDAGCEPLTTFPRELLVYGQAGQEASVGRGSVANRRGRQ